MSNLDNREPPHVCAAGPGHPGEVHVIDWREVPLGGPRAMTVRRTIPHRDRSLVGAWCFADHFGPEDVRTTGGMDVPQHPHTGLQTVSWLFTGVVEHRDSAGVHALVRPGELNLMTAGRGINHTETSTEDTQILHGVQLWVALPRGARDIARGFHHYAPEAVSFGGGEARVFLGSLLGSTSPAPTHTPLLGAELLLEPGAEVEIAVDPSFEHGVLLDTSRVLVQGWVLDHAQMAYLPTGSTSVLLANPSQELARIVLLGGAPFEEEIVMWWNFIGSSHEEIVQFRQQWMDHDERFGEVEGYTPRSNGLDRIPVPQMPAVRLRPRRR